MTSTVSITEGAATLASRFINNTNRHIFLTGKAGTGKTTFLKHIIKHTYKNAVIVAPTGIAAINAGGVTIHSLFQLPFGAFVPSKENSAGLYENQKINNPFSLIKNLHLGGSKRKLLQELELLIIDEVSMLRADVLDEIDTVLRSVRRKNHIAFGGVQVLFIGDLLQLPPVVKEEEWRLLKTYYKSIYFFEAQVLQQNKPLYIELDKIYRQADDRFISILNNLRTNQVTREDIELLNKYYQPNFKANPNDNYIQLTTHNFKADSINKEALQQIKGKSYYFKAVIKDEFNEYAHPVEDTLELKKDAQIMFIKNDPTGAQRFFNGKIGKVSNISDDVIEVYFDDEKRSIEVDKYEWQNIKYSLNEITNEIEERVIGTFTQYPIKLAWAITVHKSQGLTFSKAIIDIGQAFAPGQVYVALSRLTSLNGLILSSAINLNSLSQDITITEYAKTKDKPETLNNLFEKESQSFFRNYILQCFDFSELVQKLNYHISSYGKDEQKSAKQKYYEWAVKLKPDLEPSKTVADKFLLQLKQIVDSGNFDYRQQLHNRVVAAQGYFTPILKQFSKTILKQIEVVQSEKRMKTYTNELQELDAAFYKQLQVITKTEILLRSAINNIEFTKENINTSTENKERIEEVTKAIIPSKGRKREGKKTNKESEKGEKKINTKEASYNLYKQGKRPEQIATERAMAVSTIESHLCHYVSLGLLNVADFVEKEKQDHILSVSKKLDSILFGTIKQSLGDEYSYSEIKFAMAYYQNSKKEE